MTALPTMTTWCGRPLTELSREELIEALEQMGRLYHNALEQDAKRMEFVTSAFRRRGAELVARREHLQNVL